MENILILLAAIVSGIATAIPLISKLVSSIQALVRERNWNKMVDEMIGYMAIAKEKFDDGAEKKTWVMEMVAESAKKLKCDIDMDAIADLIDSVCDVSKILRDKK